jgi:hypothetical protein
MPIEANHCHGYMNGASEFDPLTRWYRLVPTSCDLTSVGVILTQGSNVVQSRLFKRKGGATFGSLVDHAQ